MARLMSPVPISYVPPGGREGGKEGKRRKGERVGRGRVGEGEGRGGERG